MNPYVDLAALAAAFALGSLVASIAAAGRTRLRRSVAGYDAVRFADNGLANTIGRFRSCRRIPSHDLADLAATRLDPIAAADPFERIAGRLPEGGDA